MDKLSPEQMIEAKLFDPQFLYRWINKSDDYGENRIEKIYRKLEGAQDIALFFKLDNFTLKSIILGCEISTPVFGELGEEFLKSKVPNYSRSKHARVLMEKFLSGINSPQKDKIVDGVSHVLNGEFTSPEESIVDIVNYASENTDRIASGNKQIIAYNDFIQNTIRESNKRGQLFPLKFPSIPEKFCREKRVLDKEKTIKQLDKMYSFYINHPECIPASFKKGLELPDEEILAYYIASKSDSAVKKFNEESELKRMSDRAKDE